MDKPTQNTTIVELHVPDFEKVKKFYSLLGFKVLWEYEPKGTGGYMVIKREESILSFYCGNEEVYKHPFFKTFEKDTPRGYAVEIGIPVNDIEILYETVKKVIPEHQIVEPLKLQPWGKKDFRITDPFGFYLRFAEPIDYLVP